MTLQLRRKPRITRSNTPPTKASSRRGKRPASRLLTCEQSATRRRSEIGSRALNDTATGARRRATIGIVGLLIGCFLATSIAELNAANPRRRVSPLERLKRRSASARWDELRQTWQFDQNDAAHEATSDETDPNDVARSPTGTGNHSSTAVESQSSPAPPLTGGDVNFASDTTRSAPEESRWAYPGDFDRHTSDEVFYVEDTPSLPPLPEDNSTTRPAQPLRATGRSSFVARQNVGENGRFAMERETEAMAGIENLLPKPITDILPYYDYAPNGEDPCEYMCPRPAGCPEEDSALPCPEFVELPDSPPDGRSFVEMHMLWEPSNLFHNPLYFEDHTLERYGHTHGPVLQPFVSVGKFGAQLIGLPYQMALHPPCECQYVLGWHRPGECIPYRYHFPPWNTKAAITAAAAYTGLIFLIP